jgi:acetyl-CoA carboxylase biotin carboxyl carrier protein
VSLTAKDVADILRLLNESSFDELDVEVNGARLSLRRRAGGTPASTDVSGNAQAGRVADPVSASTPSPSTPISAAGSVAPSGTSPVTAPLLGIFYCAPKPGEPPYVSVGDQVTAETIVGIIEVMKLMNTVRAGVSGTVQSIVAQNGALVEYGETLLHVRKD